MILPSSISSPPSSSWRQAEWSSTVSGQRRKESVRPRRSFKVMLLSGAFEPGHQKGPFLVGYLSNVGGRHGMRPAGLQIDLAGMLGDARVGVEHHALRRMIDAFVDRLLGMAHRAAAEHGIAHG